LICGGASGDNLSVLPPVCRDELTDINRGYLYAVISICTTRLSELSSPERLMDIHLTQVSVQGITNRFSYVNGNDNIVTVNVNQPTNLKDGRPIKRELVLS